MSRISFMSAPFLLGFDNFEERVDRLAKSAESYPPYNIERVVPEDGDETYLITIAVAGFAADDLDITHEDNQIVVRGQKQGEPQRDYLHRGIAMRQFQRAFLLADSMIVDGAELADGMLHILVRRPAPENLSRKIAIKTA
ncbi:MAG: Hsp20 family protein [Hyphomicrobiaceae bacterium]|nr:Hsp20 family protein [Hyphomicrobiaceae bacterium]MCC0023948.1 Hsp20 family protein [Hyphomicrobiaceae bacterium]